jgi:hypothetical protein
MIYADRVKDTTSTVGTADFLLDGTIISTFQRFADKFAGQVVHLSYARISTASGLWEVGKGTFDGVDTITREIVRDGSSGPGVKVTFTGSVDEIFLTTTAEQVDNGNFGLQYAMARGCANP